MADDIKRTQGTGTVINFPYYIAGTGMSSADAGDGYVVGMMGLLDGTSLYVVLKGSQARASSIPIAFSTEDIAVQAAIAASLSVLDDWDESDRAKVNLIVGQAGVSGGSGTVDAATQRTVLATDVALPAGTNTIGKLAANSGVDIGDVDVTSLVPGTSATSLGKAVDDVAGASDVGVLALVVRDDALAALTPADGDYTQARVDANGALWVRSSVPAAETVPTQVTKTVSSAGTPEALAANGTFFQSMTLVAKKAARTANTGIVYLGIGSTNDTQFIQLDPGATFTISAPPGQKYDLNDFYIDVVTANDGVMYVYS